MDMKQKQALYQQILDDLNSDEEFAKAFISVTDEAAMQKLLSERGYEVSLDDVREMFEAGKAEILKVKETAGDAELPDEALEGVAGGGFWRGLLRTTVSGGAAFGFGCLCGMAPGLAGMTPYVAGGLAAWSADGYLQEGW